MTQAGEGSIVARSVTSNGEVALRVLGKDSRHGRWTSFTAIVPWSEFQATVEHAYNEREAIAQEAIPGT